MKNQVWQSISTAGSPSMDGRQPFFRRPSERKIAGLFFGAVAVLVAVPAGAKEVDGKKIYDARCSLCHGVDGDGRGPAGSSLQPPPTNFTSADYWKSATGERVKRSIADGKPGTAMIPFAAVLKPEEIDAVVEYLRGFALAKDPAVTKGASD